MARTDGRIATGPRKPGLGGLRTVHRVAFRRSGGKNRLVSSLGYLAAVNLVIWAGLFFYVWRLDRRISEKEREP